MKIMEMLRERETNVWIRYKKQEISFQEVLLELMNIETFRTIQKENAQAG